MAPSQLPPATAGLTTNEEPSGQHVWDSEMTLLSLPLSHCYWGRDRKTKIRESVSLSRDLLSFYSHPRAST